MARVFPESVTIEIKGTNDVVQMIAQAIHDEFLPGADGYDTCNHAGGARQAIREWARRRGITLDDRITPKPGQEYIR